MKRSLFTFGIIVACIVIATAFYIFYGHSSVTAGAPPADFPGYTATAVQIDGNTIHAAIADTPALQELGLGDRDGLPVGEGMLFVFNVDKEYAFWMKDMHFSIDMVWISASKNIVYMAQDVSPATYPEDFVPTSPARYVLELPAGYAQVHGFKVGDVAIF